MQNDIQQQLEQIKESWDSISTIPDDLTPLGFAGLTKQSISDTFGGMAEIAKLLAENQNFEPLTTSKVNFQQVLSNLRTHVTQHVPSSPQPHLPGLLTYIEQARITLRSWLNEANTDNKAIPALTERLSEVVSRIKNAETLYKSIESGFDLAKESSEQAKGFANATLSSKQTAEDILKVLTESHSDVQSLILAINENAGKIRTLVEDFTSLTSELDANKKTQNALFNEFESQRQKISDLLGDANRTGMAASFISRGKYYDKPLETWMRLFVGSLVLLILMAVWVVSPLMSNGHWEDLLMRLPLSTPVIWLGWFSAKQYGYNVRLMEDYSYKAAAAMAFEGYKREMPASDEEMQKKLLEIAIKHLGENPIRIFESQNNHASPAHEFFQHSLKDEKFLDLLKAVFKKITSP